MQLCVFNVIRWEWTFKAVGVLLSQWDVLLEVVTKMQNGFLSKYKTATMLCVYEWLQNDELRLQCTALYEFGEQWLCPAYEWMRRGHQGLPPNYGMALLPVQLQYMFTQLEGMEFPHTQHPALHPAQHCTLPTND